MSGVLLARQFSRQGVGMFRFGQETVNEGVRHGYDGIFYKAAMAVSFFGLGVSVFSVQRLNAKGMFNKKSSLITK